MNLIDSFKDLRDNYINKQIERNGGKLKWKRQE